MYICTNTCMYIYMYVCMYVCMYVYIYIYGCRVSILEVTMMLGVVYPISAPGSAGSDTHPSNGWQIAF